MKTGAAIAIVVFACAAAFAGAPLQRTLSFEERVRAQEAIERVYYSHQLQATKSFEEAVPRSVLDGKVRRYLEQTVALQTYWKTTVTDATLERELARMAGGTRMPERLQELYAALGNDTFLIKECLARATLVDRLTHNFYAFDPTLHAGARSNAEELHRQLVSGALSPSASHDNRWVREIVVGAADNAQPLQERRAQLPDVVGRVSAIKETRDGFTFNVLLSATPGAARVANYVVPKTSWDMWWETAKKALPNEPIEAIASQHVSLPAVKPGLPIRSTATCAGDTWDNGVLDGSPDARYGHVAVWTGNVMVVWGADVDALGFRYDPATDSWTTTSRLGAPSARSGMTAVWSGSEVLVWGGFDEFDYSQLLDSGARYDPLTDTWTAISTAGAPTGRTSHTAVWTGTEMVVWGGRDTTQLTVNTGGRYDPRTDTWTPTSRATGTPQQREHHTAIWTGHVMVVWGGDQLSGVNLATGGRYDPVADTWTPTSMAGAPSPRTLQSAVWTGSLMVVSGGLGGSQLNDGGRYDPVTDTWTSMSNTDPALLHYGQSAVWTGRVMVVWGGGGGGYLDTGGRYDPATDTWTPTSTVAAPTPRASHTAVWTGSAMVVWGGYDPYAGGPLNSGGRYDPDTDTWTPTARSAASPSRRTGHVAVWTGSSMIVWGGDDYVGQFLNTGGKYDPATDSWTTTSLDNAPVGRTAMKSVWTGSSMVVWGGATLDMSRGVSYNLNSGGRYDPITDTWMATSLDGAPSERVGHSAVWMGFVMAVWGGYGGDPAFPRNTELRTGALYDPAADLWSPMSVTGAPSARYAHTAVWTGNAMVVWGGLGIDPETQSSGALNTGGRYDPSTDGWSPTTTVGAPPGLEDYSAVWTGRALLIWGGAYNDPTSYHGASYNPTTNAWRPISRLGEPLPRSRHTAVWTGHEMIIWGGVSPDDFYNPPTTGGRYDPVTNTWSATSTVNAPVGRYEHTAVWTGDYMMVWGGLHGQTLLASGGRYRVSGLPDDDCDGDGFTGTEGDCDDLHGSVYPGAPQICDGLDNDCSDPAWPALPTDEADQDEDAVLICQGDCDDTSATVYPGAPETCDGIDDNCDGAVDEGGDALCDDGNGCTDDSCHGSSGCVHTNNTNACDDGTTCTSGDVCGGGSCHGTPVDDGTGCDDGNACTAKDTCLSGTCVSGVPVVCDDGNVCNGVEWCDDAIGCVSTGPPACGDGNACNGTETCDPILGCLGGTPLGCNDGNACNGVETCDPGTGCVSGAPLHCDDENACTTDSCNPATGCVYADNTDPCNDGNPCTFSDACDNGLCHGTTIDGVACDDGDVCTLGDACDGGACRGTRIDCDDANACTADSCNFLTGCVHDPSLGQQCDDGNPCTINACDPIAGCTYPPAAAGTACDDFMNCTSSDRCDGQGSCVGVSVCDDGNPCTDDFADEKASCACSHAPGPDGVACNDGNACTTGDACDGGACVGGTPVLCTPSDQCHGAGSCDPASGLCSNPAAPNGTTCDDGSSCTSGETCQNGTCTPASDGHHRPHPRSSGYYEQLCDHHHSGDRLTDADAVCVGQLSATFAGISDVDAMCDVLDPDFHGHMHHHSHHGHHDDHPSNSQCDKAEKELMALALNICRGRVCQDQGIDSSCDGNASTTVAQSFAEADAILANSNRDTNTCRDAKCLAKEINNGHALELDSLSIVTEGNAIRLRWVAPELDDGTGDASSYTIQRRVIGSGSEFTPIGTTTGLTFLDTTAGSGAFEYEVTVVVE